jgi:hypothetical protein
MFSIRDTILYPSEVSSPPNRNDDFQLDVQFAWQEYLMPKIIDVFSLFSQLMVVDFAFVKEMCYAWVIMCMQVCCGMFQCMNVHI